MFERDRERTMILMRVSACVLERERERERDNKRQIDNDPLVQLRLISIILTTIGLLIYNVFILKKSSHLFDSGRGIAPS